MLFFIVFLLLLLLLLLFWGVEIVEGWRGCMFVWFVFWDRVSLCSPGCPGTHSVDQAGLELRNQPASASRVLEFKVCISTAGLGLCTFKNYYLLNVYEYTVAVSDKQEEGIRSHYRWLWATMWLLGIELRISGRVVSALNCWAISPAPEDHFDIRHGNAEFGLCSASFLSCFGDYS